MANAARKGKAKAAAGRLWRSVKYEEVYLRAYDTVSEARASIGRYLDSLKRYHPINNLQRVSLLR